VLSSAEWQDGEGKKRRMERDDEMEKEGRERGR
jgi:hypothetical protein